MRYVWMDRASAVERADVLRPIADSNDGLTQFLAAQFLDWEPPARPRGLGQGDPLKSRVVVAYNDDDPASAVGWGVVYRLAPGTRVLLVVTPASEVAEAIWEKLRAGPDEEADRFISESN